MEKRCFAAPSRLHLPWFMGSQNAGVGRDPAQTFAVQLNRNNFGPGGQNRFSCAMWMSPSWSQWCVLPPPLIPVHRYIIKFIIIPVHRCIIKFTEIILWSFHFWGKNQAFAFLRSCSALWGGWPKGIGGDTLCQGIRKENGFSCPLRKHWPFIRAKNISSSLRQMQARLLLAHHMDLKVTSARDAGQVQDYK